ncbi:transmembrane protein 72 isoform X2 [Narcine bancroftii]|uniref:transmembrane protein 72 isoform X2 n=1 Tax=Narcine bancroftii TaxID=1343680 RepID=UPI00383174F5
MATARRWAMLELTCRILGITTAAVLLGVGVGAAVEGPFTKLAVYLLFAAAVLTILEGPYFIDIVLVHHCPYSFQEANKKVWNLWKKALRPNGFQKFLIFIFLSVACFLHPILIWHATIPGTMLIVSGLAYFVLNLRKRFQVGAPEESEKGRVAQEYVTAMVLSDAGETQQTYSFQHHAEGKRLGLINRIRSLFRVSTDCPPASEATRTYQECAVATPTEATTNKGPLLDKRAIKVILSEPGELEEQGLGTQEITSDRCPILPK